MRRSHREKKLANINVFAAFLLIFLLIISASADVETDLFTVSQHSATSSEYPWMDIVFTDINGKKQTIADAKTEGPVILHLFTIWCPSCTKQLTESTNFLQEQNKNATVISFDIDSKESEADIRTHIAKNGFEGVFSVAPDGLVPSLSDSFGSKVSLSIPQTIVITDESVTYIGAGVVSKARLQNALSDNLSEHI